MFLAKFEQLTVEKGFIDTINDTMATIALDSVIEVNLHVPVEEKLFVLGFNRFGGSVLKDVTFPETQQLSYSMCTFAFFEPFPPTLKENSPHRIT